MPFDPRCSPAFLKLDLYCRGAQLHDSLFVEHEGSRPIVRTRAGLGSGLEIILPGGHWTNVPVVEEFVKRSPYLLRRRSGEVWLEHHGDWVSPARLAPLPDWYARRTASGKPMSRVGTLQGTYLGVYPTAVCDFWRGEEKSNCHFCSVGLNLGGDDASEKSLADVVEVARAAVRESGVTYVDFNTGHYEGETYLDRIEPYVKRVKQAAGTLIGLQTPPHSDLRRYDDLRDAGVNRVSFCFEIFDEARFREVCPGKSRTYGLKRYLDAIAHTARLGRERSWRGALERPWVVNGEIIAGLEPVASTIRAIEWITSVGAVPTVCVFRPLKGTDFEQLPPPSAVDLLPVFQRLYTACMERGLPIGVAPNVHVSLVLLPEECGELVPRGLRRRASELKLAALRAVLARRLRVAREQALARPAAA